MTKLLNAWVMLLYDSLNRKPFFKEAKTGKEVKHFIFNKTVSPPPNQWHFQKSDENYVYGVYDTTQYYNIMNNTKNTFSFNSYKWVIELHEKSKFSSETIDYLQHLCLS